MPDACGQKQVPQQQHVANQRPLKMSSVRTPAILKMQHHGKCFIPSWTKENHNETLSNDPTPNSLVKIRFSVIVHAI